MKKKKSEPVNFTASFADKAHTQDEVIEAFIVLAKLACDAGVEKRLNSKKFNSEEERVEEMIEQKQITEKFLYGLKEQLRKSNFGK